MTWLLEWLIAFVLALMGAIPAPAPAAPPADVEIGTALACEAITEAEVLCQEIDGAGVVVREWVEPRP